ncbi:hypothetical protein HG536_0D01860 [Torulaspora globosa]|uniref:Uncharacterized protein n=1 Tax=Torulaspora globosa TaxID=48254 RepID=A0A7G3ZGM8_9SACH|nr:uncharacterized protein HG536_0D01860 [Torulaspora globosa]QLL32664.1 hypothetical protein HG536_0D01860 [Torulaspora globosa]
MRPWKIAGIALVLFLSRLLQCCAATAAHSDGVTKTAEEILCLLYIEGRAPHAKLYETLQVLRTVRCQISRLKQEFVEQTSTLAAIESLLALKSEQIARSDRTMRGLLAHLKQVSSALSIALNGDRRGGETPLQIPANAAGKSLAMDFLSSYIESNAADSRAAKIRVLKTGAFLMVMLSTTADVCVITGPVVCFALYVAGSGAVVIWLAQIYRTMFGNDGMPEPNWQPG